MTPCIVASHISLWNWPQLASCDLGLHVGQCQRCNDRLRHLWHAEQKQQLQLRSNERPRTLWHTESKQRRTEATEHRPHKARKQQSGARTNKEKKTRESQFGSTADPKCFQSSFRGASKVPKQSNTKVHLATSRAASERSPGGSWDLPGHPRERLGELRGRLGDHVGSISDLRAGGLS